MTVTAESGRMEKTVLFVYCSLMRGQINHLLIEDQEFLGEAVTEAKYRLIEVGFFPGLVPNEASGLKVRGELWAVSEECLSIIDRFEGENYRRRPVAIHAWTQSVEAYFWTGTIKVLGRSGSVWPFD